MKIKHLYKRHYLLLEVMIAMILLVLCAFPILRAYVNMSKTQLEDSRYYQRDHIAHLMHTKIVEMIYKGSFPWNDLKQGKTGDISALEGMDEYVQTLKNIQYKGEYTLSLFDEKKGKKDGGLAKFLLELKVRMVDTSKEKYGKHQLFIYYIYGQRAGEANEVIDRSGLGYKNAGDDEDEVPDEPVK